MERLPKAELEEIVRNSMPGYRMVESQPVSVDGPLPAQTRGPSLERLQRKLDSLVVPYQAPKGSAATDSQSQDVVQAVEVAPRSGRFTNERKTVLVSAAKKQIVGRQG